MSHFTIAYPYLLLLIPLFYLFYFFSGFKQQFPFYLSKTSYSVHPSWRVRFRGPILHTLLFGLITSLVIGASRPQQAQEIDNQKHRNIILCLDVSLSMESEDLMSDSRVVSRLEGVKKVVKEFVSERTKDRIGLVVFGGRAFLQAPLTLDHTFVSDVVGMLHPGIAGDGTAIGDGLGVSLKRIRDLPAGTRTIVLMTDGANNAGSLDPLQAAEIAKEVGIKIHTIGIGSKEISQSGVLGGFLGAPAEFDEETLKKIATTSNGTYFNIQSTQALRDVYEEIDALDESELKDASDRVVHEYYPQWALISLFFLLSYLVFHQGPLLRVPI